MLSWAKSLRRWIAVSAVFVAESGHARAEVAVPPTAESDAPAPAPHVKLNTVRIESGAALATLSNGETAKLTLDAELQAAAARLIAGAQPLAGAVVMLDVATGRVLALQSFQRRGAPPGNPLLAAAPAASLFKLVTTAALFEHSEVQPNTQVCFNGGERQIERRHLDRPAQKDARCARFASALGHSWNAVYAQLATEHLMRDELLATAEGFGFNSDLNFDVAASFGSVSLPYNDLEFARAAAGFRGSMLTPLGAAQLTYGIALGGRPARMRLIASAPNLDVPRGREWLDRFMSANAAWRLTRMMEVTVHGGTSLSAFTQEDGSSYLGSIRVAGKTGTLRPSANAPTTSWFTGFAPSREPKVVVTVMLQNGEVWREKANQVARDLLRFYFAGKPGVTSPFENNDAAELQVSSRDAAP
jgi:peptidoglycan glycosyltransferase